MAKAAVDREASEARREGKPPHALKDSEIRPVLATLRPEDLDQWRVAFTSMLTVRCPAGLEVLEMDPMQWAGNKDIPKYRHANQWVAATIMQVLDMKSPHAVAMREWLLSNAQEYLTDGRYMFARVFQPVGDMTGGEVERMWQDFRNREYFWPGMSQVECNGNAASPLALVA